MPAIFDRDGVTLQYPENWRVNEDDYEPGWAISLESPGTALFTMMFDRQERDAIRVADTALAALREEYPGLESRPGQATLAGLPVVGYDIEFFSLDLTNTCFIRGLTLAQGTLLIIAQTADVEEQNIAVLQAMLSSIAVADEA